MKQPKLLGVVDQNNNVHLKKVDPPTCRQIANNWVEARVRDGLLLLVGIVIGLVISWWR